MNRSDYQAMRERLQARQAQEAHAEPLWLQVLGGISFALFILLLAFI